MHVGYTVHIWYIHIGLKYIHDIAYIYGIYNGIYTMAYITLLQPCMNLSNENRLDIWTWTKSIATRLTSKFLINYK